MNKKWYTKYRIVIMGVLVSVILGMAPLIIELVSSQQTQVVSLSLLITLVGTTISLGIEAIVQIKDVNQKIERDDLRVVALHRTEYADEFVNLKQRASYKIDILGISLGQALGDFLNDPLLISKIFKGVNIRLLFLNPSSGYISQRAREDGVPPDELKRQLISSVKKSARIFQSLKQEVSKARKIGKLNRNRLGSIEIRMYNDSPYCTFFMVDDQMLWGLYLSSGYGFNHAMLTFPHDCEELRLQFTTHFTQIWRNSAESFLLRFNRRFEDPVANSNLLKELLGEQWCEAS